jgi:16S rRNA (adenine1518-N6/adenine1519-N6)-dimethyltransferase
MSARQTSSFLRQRFAEAGIRPNTRHGQNFLIDLNLVRLLADAADLDRRDVVLEVGTGTGSLTALLAERAAAVVSVEVDRQLHQLALEELSELPNVTLLCQDALKNKNQLQANMLETVRQRMADVPHSRFKVAANLPYSVATPVISNLLAWPLVPDSITVTIQKELADRIMARPSTKDYGALSMWIQSQCEIELIRELPPSVFWPRPKVTSTILQIRPRPEKRRAIRDPVFFHQFVRALFLHRRKFLRSELVAAFKQLTKPVADQIIAGQGLSPDARAEQLTWEQALALAEVVQSRIA